MVTLKLKEDEPLLYAHAEAVSSAGTGASTIRNTIQYCLYRPDSKRSSHAFFRRNTPLPAGRLSMKAASMTISQIVSLVESCSPEELAFMEDGARMNSALADYGMQHKLGIGAASSLAKYCRTDIMGNSLMSRIMTLMASSAEGRMCGCPYAVMSSAGSGNHGLTTILPVVETARYLGSDKEHLVKRRWPYPIPSMCILRNSPASCPPPADAVSPPLLPPLLPWSGSWAAAMNRWDMPSSI